MIPVDTATLIISHSGEEHTTGLGLFNDVLNGLRTPVIVLAVILGIPSDSQRLGGAEDSTTMTAHTVFIVTPYLIILGIIVMDIKAALVDTDLTLNTPFRIPINHKLWR